MRRRWARLKFAGLVLLAVAPAALWARTFWATETLDLGRARYDKRRDGGDYVVESLELTGSSTSFGGMYWRTRHATADVGADQPVGWRGERVVTDPAAFAWGGVRGQQSAWRRLGFHLVAETFGQPATTSVVMWVPAWLVVACCALPLALRPLRWLARSIQARRRQRQCLCGACGYDLRGAAHERCPECGEAVAAARV